MNKRLMVDQLLANRKKYGSRVMAKAKILVTWKGMLQDEKSLLEDWIDQGGVLMGIMPVWWRPRGRPPSLASRLGHLSLSLGTPHTQISDPD
ncbi:uncharacterized protein EV420DRAFT_1651042 [Desarmillaria tabescens]|uniref:Uncharacterized protein n=1 Tax=Armillaria tabescens TaxID=1929756 RepID=A0AA39JC48_ARMTA|nr:uncharacterized protein EV420DRAFT_1651042 [Desarmillaria tabescens]KAK0439275.1 hypothetical protein EV420DRAFT_1651042 [Desarmillaria tabescens]